MSECTLFENKAINRKLNSEGIKSVLDYIVASGSGEYEDLKSLSRMKIYWKSIEDWANDIYNFAVSSGWIGGIYTISEINEGEDTVGQCKKIDWEIITSVILNEIIFFFKY